MFYAYAVDTGDEEGAASVTDFQGRKKRSKAAFQEAMREAELAKAGEEGDNDQVSTLIAQIMQTEQESPDIAELMQLINGAGNG